jgi:hypothetical protein
LFIHNKKSGRLITGIIKNQLHPSLRILSLGRLVKVLKIGEVIQPEAERNKFGK